jgi:hypothetical protein
MHEIPDNINITETATSTNDGLEDVVFDERYNDEESSDDEQGLPNNAAGRKSGADSLSEDESDEDDDGNNFYNPNRMPKKTGNLNARNLIGSKKDSGKGARNDRRDAISASDSDENDELAHI